MFTPLIGTRHNAVGQDFTTSGSWVVPAGVHQARFLVVAGGGGGASETGGNLGGGGGGGGEAVDVTTAVTPFATVTVTVGAGGIAEDGFGAGTDGEDSSCTGGGLAFTITAKGGKVPVSGSLSTGGDGGSGDPAKKGVGGAGGGSDPDPGDAGGAGIQYVDGNGATHDPGGGGGGGGFNASGGAAGASAGGDPGTAPTGDGGGGGGGYDATYGRGGRGAIPAVQNGLPGLVRITW